MRYWQSKHNSTLCLSSEEIQQISEQTTAEYHPWRSAFPAPRHFPPLLLLPVDPCHLHAYWWILNKKLETVQSPLMLRLFWRNGRVASLEDLSGRCWEIGPVANRADIKLRLPVAGAVYMAALGHGDPARGFVEVARSAPVDVPAGTTVGARRSPPAMPQLFDEAAIDRKVRATLRREAAEEAATFPAAILDDADGNINDAFAIDMRWGVSSATSYEGGNCAMRVVDG